jgi:hypothetical protein
MILHQEFTYRVEVSADRNSYTPPLWRTLLRASWASPSSAATVFLCFLGLGSFIFSLSCSSFQVLPVLCFNHVFPFVFKQISFLLCPFFSVISFYIFPIFCFSV